LGNNANTHTMTELPGRRMARALLLLDLSRDVAHPRGRFGRRGSAQHARDRKVPEAVARATTAARRIGDLVVWVLPNPSLFSDTGLPPSDEWGSAIDESFGSPMAPDWVVHKRAIDAFERTDLAERLRAREIDEVVLSGISTTHVVKQSALGALAHGFRVVIVVDGCADHSEEAHITALDSVRGIVDVAHFCDVWPDSAH
jgi:nicotinamidase-related amidase